MKPGRVMAISLVAAVAVAAAWFLFVRGGEPTYRRRTVTSWIRAAGLSGEYRPCYTTVAAAGKRADLIAAHKLFGRDVVVVSASGG